MARIRSLAVDGLLRDPSKRCPEKARLVYVYDQIDSKEAKEAIATY